jgi:hypothetical protein
MFKANQNSEKPENDERVNRSRPAKPTERLFCDLAEFSNWIDSRLVELEQSYSEFETIASRRDHFER